MTTITVSSASELKTAYATLSGSGGGTILVAEGAELYGIDLNGSNTGTDAVTITSSNIDDPVELTAIRLSNIENVTVQNVAVDTSDVPGTLTDDNLYIGGGKNIVIKDSTFNGRASEFYNTSLSEDDQSDDLGNIRNSSNITFEGNTVTNYSHGLGVFESTGVDIIGNDISGIQSDGIRMAGVQDVDILNNHLHDFYGSPNNINHDDMIQVWSKGAKLITKDLTISGNFLNSGDGTASQSIFIGNERDGDEPDHIFQNITITDNVIYNGHKNGIVVSGAKGVLVEDNTLLLNINSKIYSTKTEYLEDDGAISAPMVRFARIQDGEATGNIAAGVPNTTSTYTSTDNKIVSFYNETSANYAGKHFVNVVSGGAADIYDLQLLEDSPWAGSFGASSSQPHTSSADGPEAVMSITAALDDMWELNLDASFSIDEDGAARESEYDFVWTFADGTTQEGLRVSKLVDSPGEQSVTLDLVKDGVVVDSIVRTLTVQDKELAALSFESGIQDTSSYDSSFKYAEDGNLVSTQEGTGYKIGGADKLSLVRGNAQIHNLETFGMTIRMESLTPETGGTFISFHKVMTATLSSEGAVTFKLETNEGYYKLTTQEGLFQDGQMHTLGIGFDGVNGALEITYDGETVASGEAFGVTAGKTSYGLIIGNTFSSSLDAVVEEFNLNADPAAAGVIVERVAPPPAVENDPTPVTQTEQPTKDNVEPMPAENAGAKDPTEASPVTNKGAPAKTQEVDQPTVAAEPVNSPVEGPAEAAPGNLIVIRKAPDPQENVLPAQEAPAVESTPVTVTEEIPLVEETPSAEVVQLRETEETQASDSGSDNDGNFFAKLLSAILSIFGMGGGRNSSAGTKESLEDADSTEDMALLSDVVPMTKVLPEDAGSDVEENYEASDEYSLLI